MMTGLFVAGVAQQMARADRAETAGEMAAGTAAEIRTQNMTIMRDVEKLFMITESLWTILKEKHGYVDEDLGQMIREIDLRDGRLDGKVARQQNPLCPQCARTLMGKHPVCLYCGTAVVRDPFER